MRTFLAAWVLTALALLHACTSPMSGERPSAPANSSPAGSASGGASPSAVARYRCEQNIEFTVRFAGDSAMIDAGPRGSEVLLRDAGGATPQQTVYSNARMRAEFGLGVSGRDAILRYALPPLAARCVRD